MYSKHNNGNLLANSSDANTGFSNLRIHNHHDKHHLHQCLETVVGAYKRVFSHHLSPMSSVPDGAPRLSTYSSAQPLISSHIFLGLPRLLFPSSVFRNNSLEMYLYLDSGYTIAKCAILNIYFLSVNAK